MANSQGIQRNKQPCESGFHQPLTVGNQAALLVNMSLLRMTGTIP
jgi:hypothetical protein